MRLFNGCYRMTGYIISSFSINTGENWQLCLSVTKVLPHQPHVVIKSVTVTALDDTFTFNAYGHIMFDRSDSTLN